MLGGGEHPDQDQVEEGRWSGCLRSASRGVCPVEAVRDQRGEELMSVHACVRLQEVDVQVLDAARLELLNGAERMARFEEVADAAQASLAGHAVLNVTGLTCPGGLR